MSRAGSCGLQRGALPHAFIQLHSVDVSAGPCGRLVLPPTCVAKLGPQLSGSYQALGGYTLLICFICIRGQRVGQIESVTQRLYECLNADKRTTIHCNFWLFIFHMPFASSFNN